MGDDRPPWHNREADAAIEALGSDRQGLKDDDASQRLERHGYNRIGQKREVSAWRVLLHQFKSPLIYVLLGALVVTVGMSLLTGEQRWADAIVIGLVLVVNGTVGFIQEYRAEHSVEALMKMVAPKALVRRDGQEQRVEAARIVPGDIVLLEEGSVVPADIRLIDAHSLQIDESALTGESVPVGKSDRVMVDSDAELPPDEQKNMAFMGTAVTAGHAEGMVTATGMATQIGGIARQVEETGETKTPLQRRIQRLAILITWGILAVSGAAMGIGLLMGYAWPQMITLAVALSVAAIPAGLPIVVTVALAIGVRRMARRHAVIRHLPAVDTLGSCTTIISDKTGTLTQNRMTVKSIFAAGKRYDVSGEARTTRGGIEHNGEAIEVSEHLAVEQLIRAGILCNDAKIGLSDEASEPDEQDAEDETSGDPMEVALLYAGTKAGLDPEELRSNYRAVDEVPFQTERRFMASIREQEDDEGPLVLIKGAPETVLGMCDTQRAADGSDNDLDRDMIERANDELAGEGLRVLAMAESRGESAAEAVQSDEPQGFTFLGLVGLLDPPRETAAQAVDDAHAAGIRVMMVTGDHARTASAISQMVHVDQPAAYQTEKRTQDSDELPPSHTGKEIEDSSDEELDEMLEASNIYARVQPAQKTRIVSRLKDRGQIVAVTGDGVNDAPALKSAHLGAAMGSGTDVAKESSDMVITDDNFASVYSAVEQGRTAFRNIRMATFFLLSTGAADVLIILAALAMGWPLPLLAAQILWCNVVTNGIADVALAFEPGEKSLFRRPPRPPSEGVLDRLLLERLVLVGIWLSVGVLGMFVWKWGFDVQSWTGDEDKLTLARTAALTTLVLFQKVHVFNCRSEDVSIFRKPLLANKLLFIGVLVSLGVHIAAIHIPLTQQLLSLTPMDAQTWAVATCVALTAIIVNELHKRFRPRANQARQS